MNRKTETSGERTLVKICGLRRPEDAEAANHLMPEMAGFILSPGFRRSIDGELADTLRRILSPQIRTVGVFVDAPYGEILKAAEGGLIDMIQLHGKEDNRYIKEITGLTGLPVIKAFRVDGREDLEEAALSAAPWILLDSGSGTGRCFDWNLLEKYLTENASAEHMSREHLEKQEEKLFPGGRRWLLAGGLSAENVAAAIRRFHPTGVDVSSNVETDGRKDPVKMAAFTTAVRQE